MLKNFTLIVFCLAALTVSSNAQKTSPPAAAPNQPKKANQRAPVGRPKKETFEIATIETMSAQCVKFETEAGVIEMEMFPESAPESVRSFLNLVATGALDTTTFSRVVPKFVIQGGNLSTREKLTPELVKRATRPVRDEPSMIKHERGILSMARTDEPNSATTHFFILVDSAPHLDGKFAAFGRVTSGMEAVDAINKMPVEGDAPKKPVRITRATVAPCQVSAPAVK